MVLTVDFVRSGPLAPRQTASFDPERLPTLIQGRLSNRSRSFRLQKVVADIAVGIDGSIVSLSQISVSIGATSYATGETA
jgi:hypothetical protein